MQNDCEEWDSTKKELNFTNSVSGLSQVVTKASVAAAGINVDTPIVSAIIGNLTGTLPTKKDCAKQVKCEICNCNLSSQILLQSHIRGAKHQRKLKDLEVFNKLNGGENSGIQKSREFICGICSLKVNSAVQLEIHLSGVKHKRKADRLTIFQPDKNKNGKQIQSVLIPKDLEAKNERYMYTCHTCNILLNSKNQQNQHMNSKKHKIKEKLTRKRWKCRTKCH